MEIEGSLPHSQPVPILKSTQSMPHALIPLPDDPFYYYYPPIYTWFLQVVLSLRILHKIRQKSKLLRS